MTPAKKKRFEYKDISFDSNEEIFIYRWLQDAQYVGLIRGFEYQPQKFLLSEPVRINNKHALRQHVYTADFIIHLDPQYNSKLKPVFKFIGENDTQVYIDVKGGFNLYNNHTEFSINRKWLYSKYGIFVYKIEPDKLFKLTYVPQECRYTPKTQKLREKYKDCRNIEQYLKEVIL